MSLSGSPRIVKRLAGIAASALLIGTTSIASALPAAGAGVERIQSAVTGSDGKTYSITNHITRDWHVGGDGRRHEWLLVWTGDEESGADGAPDPDFLAVVDATRGPTYGKVVNTVTIDSIFANEPHHMQYSWHKGNKVYAGGLLSDTVFVFDVSELPKVTLSGITLPHDTPCGTAPDAFAVLNDGTAYGTWMGGPDVAGPCTYTDGQTRVGNGPAGSPGEVVRLSDDGTVLSEAPAAKAGGEDPRHCPNEPALPEPTCANPHGIAVREDLDRMITSDFVEVRHVVSGQVPDPNIQRKTVRIFDISDRARPKLLNVSYLPDGPRQDNPYTREGLLAMEPAVTHQPHHRGAFAATGMGAVYYTPDIMVDDPEWREVFDDATAFKSIYPENTPTSAADGGSWLALSRDDRFLFHTVMFPGQGSPEPNTHAGMIYTLDVQALLASGADPRCHIDQIRETTEGGDESDCPSLVNAVPIIDRTTGGPHWAALDNFRKGKHGYYRESDRGRRIVSTNFFVSATPLSGNNRVCMTNVSGSGRLSPDTSFRDEHTGERCLNFNRTQWPHGATGAALPHGVLFAVADKDVR
ncbi:hypothetical protein [Haloechinothrix salitolerans]|uniref:Uncharacterized protein n=1 Tax=Haloechinothrix salitolerans TaxID=926830 RepID=A0ABW2BVA2_9PSEU